MKPITIVGGGLAGLTLGILLRRENAPVAVVEAGNYPRHRVCGEFLSGRGREILHTVEVEQKIAAKSEARNCSFHLPNRPAVRFELQSPALAVSRFDLDAALAAEFESSGGILKTGQRLDEKNAVDGVVRATGRRRSVAGKGKLFGLKAHAANASASSDLEMHFGNRHYVGISRLPGGVSNVCGLFFSEQPLRDSWKEILRRSIFSESLRSSDWVEDSFCSIAGLTWDREIPRQAFSIGDAAAMIPPLTGNGMSMAFESAQAALPFVLRYSRGQTSWPECLAEHNESWRTQFSARLQWAAFIQQLIFRPVGQNLLYFTARLFPSMPQFFFSRTR